jgi:TonB family protein
MYFDFDDRYIDVEPVGRAISLRDGVGFAVGIHALIVLLLVFGPKYLPLRSPAALVPVAPQQKQDKTFVFVQPKVDIPAPRPPERAELSDLDRRSATVERSPEPSNPLPYSRGNTAERVDTSPDEKMRGRGPADQPAPETPASDTTQRAPDPQRDAQMAMMQSPQPPKPPAGGSLGDALRNLQKYVQRDSFDNQRGGNNQEFGPAIQFDTKGVEFGPWIRRFVAQVRRNWFVPYAAMSLKGQVVITFNVHRNGTITDVTVVRPSAIESFNTSAVNALLSSNPTEPLPPEYPDDRAFFTVTFYYNETP